MCPIYLPSICAFLSVSSALGAAWPGYGLDREEPGVFLSDGLRPMSFIIICSSPRKDEIFLGPCSFSTLMKCVIWGYAHAAFLDSAWEFHQRLPSVTGVTSEYWIVFLSLLLCQYLTWDWSDSLKALDSTYSLQSSLSLQFEEPLSLLLLPKFTSTSGVYGIWF